MSKTFVDQIPPEGGRKYSIAANGDGTSSITDVTAYQQAGTPWAAADANQAMRKEDYDANGDGVVDSAAKVAHTLTLKDSAGTVLAAFDGSAAAALQLTKALVGLGSVDNTADGAKKVNSASRLRPLTSDWTAEVSGSIVCAVKDAAGVFNILESNGGAVKVAQASTITEVLPITRGGTGAAKVTLNFSSVVVTTNSAGAFYLTGLAGVIAAVGSVGSDNSATKLFVGFSSNNSAQIEGFIYQDYDGMPVPNTTVRVNLIYYNI